jgi:hypothetical protein
LDQLSDRAIAYNPNSAQPVEEYCQEDKIINQSARISREELSRLPHIAPGNSTAAMHHFLNLPYCVIGNSEFYPADWDEATWIAINYTIGGTYDYYGFSANNFKTQGEVEWRGSE